MQDVNYSTNNDYNDNNDYNCLLVMMLTIIPLVESDWAKCSMNNEELCTYDNRKISWYNDV